MRTFPSLTTCLLLGLASVGCARAPEPERRPPVILFSIDTLRADRLGCYGCPLPTSPNLDRFAGEAVVFREALAAAPNTAPSHMSIFTSLSPIIHGVRNFGEGGRRLPASLPTLPAFLRREGYLTVGIHGGGNLGGELGFGEGFDHYAPEFFRWPEGEGVLEAGLDELAAVEERIRAQVRHSRDEGRPIFLFLHHYLCHDPYLSGPAEYRLRFLTDPVKGLPVKPEDIRPGGGFQGMRDRFFGPADPDNPEHTRHYLALYDGGVFYSDYVFGRVRRVLEEEGIFADSLFVVVADHGEELRDHGGILHWKLFRETIRVPLIIKFPDNRYAGEEVDTPVSTLDIFPTVAAWLGLGQNLPPHQGHSLLPLVTGDEAYVGDPVSFSGPGNSLRLSRGGATYINQEIDGVGERLFLAGDREERRNLARERKATARLRALARDILAENQALAQRLTGGEAEQKPEADEERRRQLRALGYLN